MASNGAKQPLLSGLVDPASQIINECHRNRRRIRHVKSPPLAESVPSDTSGNGPIPCCGSFWGGLHQSLKKVALLLAVYLGLGTICFYAVRDDIKGKKTNPNQESDWFSSL
jgi:potassium channel subfamily K